MVRFDRGCLGHLCAKLLAKFRNVVGEYRCFVAGAGDGNVAKSGTEQVWVDARVGMNQHALGSEALGAMAGNGVAMIEVTMFGGIEFDLAVVVEPGGDSAVW